METLGISYAMTIISRDFHIGHQATDEAGLFVQNCVGKFQASVASGLDDLVIFNLTSHISSQGSLIPVTNFVRFLRGILSQKISSPICIQVLLSWSTKERGCN